MGFSFVLFFGKLIGEETSLQKNYRLLVEHRLLLYAYMLVSRLYKHVYALLKTYCHCTSGGRSSNAGAFPILPPFNI